MLQSGRHDAFWTVLFLLVVGGDDAVEGARLAAVLIEGVDDGRVVVRVAAVVGRAPRVQGALVSQLPRGRLPVKVRSRLIQARFLLGNCGRLNAFNLRRVLGEGTLGLSLPGMHP